jgi:prepilin-type N-terminal cleavage/methylation domain-containing protein
MKGPKPIRDFTLMELLMVVSIIALLAAITFSLISGDHRYFAEIRNWNLRDKPKPLFLIKEAK